MARRQPLTIEPGAPPPDAPHDDELEQLYDALDETDRRQAEVGTLFSIQGPQFAEVAWAIHRYRTKAEMAMDPQGKPEQWVADVTGELKGSELLPIIGGGTFHFYGHVPNPKGGVRLAYNRVISLAGPRKNFDLPDPAAAPPATAAVVSALPAPDPTERLIRLMIHQQKRSDERMERLILAMAQNRHEAPSAKPQSIGEIIAAVGELDRLRGGGSKAIEDPIAVAKMVLDGFHQGVTIGQSREPVEANGSDPNYMPLVERGLEILNTVLSRGPQRPAGPPRPRSEARVVETPPSTNGTTPPAAPATAAPPPPTHQASAHRWETAVEALYRAMIGGRDPIDFADSLEDILNPEEVSQLRGVGMPTPPSADMVFDYLAPVISQYPPLDTPGGRVYLQSVLTALVENGEEEIPEAEVVKP